jgi:hypothetical protein
MKWILNIVEGLLWGFIALVVINIAIDVHMIWTWYH